MSIARRRARRTSAAFWVVLGIAALVVHATALGTVRAVGIADFNLRKATKPLPEARETELAQGCVANAYLAASARDSMCLAPWQPDAGACFDEAQNDMWLDLSACDARHMSSTEIAMIDPKQAEKIKSIDPEPLLDAFKQAVPDLPKPVEVPPPHPNNPPPPPPPPPPAPKRPMQIVETAKPSDEKAPDNARFLAEYDTKVDHQTVARGTPKEEMVAKSKPAELVAKADPKEASVHEQEIDRMRGADRRAPDMPGTLSMRTPGARAPAELQQDLKTLGSMTGGLGAAADGYLTRKGDGAIEQQRKDRSELPRGQGGAGGGQPQVPNLKPSQDVLERALGGGNVDHLDDVDNGDETALTAKRFIYASFFNRMKRAVAQNWDPASVWRRSDPTGAVYGFKTRVTEVRVSLSPHGDLAHIVVVTPSGVGDLDEEAVRSFHAAAPFPNPPKELVGSDNLITFAFSFYFEIGGGHPSYRVIRSM